MESRKGDRHPADRRGLKNFHELDFSGLQHLNYWERLARLKLMSLQRRRERYIILMMWKILHNIVPNCCHIDFKMTSRHGTIAVIPPLAKSSSSSNQTLYDQSFAVQGPKLWNKVPNSVKAAQSCDAIEISLSTFLALIRPSFLRQQLQLVDLIGRLVNST